MHVDWFLVQGIGFSALISGAIWASMVLVTDQANFCKTPDMCERIPVGPSKVWERDKTLPTWPLATLGEHDRVPQPRDWRLIRNGVSRDFLAGECAADFTSEADTCTRGGGYPTSSLEHVAVQ